MFTTSRSGSPERHIPGKHRVDKAAMAFGRLVALVGLGTMAMMLVSCGDDTVATDDADATDDVTDGDDKTESTDDGADGPYPVADLSVQYSHDDGTTMSYRILCDGNTASVNGTSSTIVAHDACLALADPDVAERLVSGPPPGRVCTEIYGGSDKAVVTGSIGGKTVETVVDRTNGCGIDEWDALLADLLPPARGA